MAADPLERLANFQAQVQAQANRYTYEGITGAADQIGALPERIANMEATKVAIAGQRARTEQIQKQMAIQDRMIALRFNKLKLDNYEAQTRAYAEETDRKKMEAGRDKEAIDALKGMVGVWIPGPRGPYRFSYEMGQGGIKVKTEYAADKPEAERAAADEQAKKWQGGSRTSMSPRAEERAEESLTLRRRAQEFREQHAAQGQRVRIAELRKQYNADIGRAALLNKPDEVERLEMERDNAIDSILGETKAPSGPSEGEKQRATLDALKGMMDSLKGIREKIEKK